MQPWKMFIRSVSVVTVLTAGGFAAGQAVVPFANASRGVSPAVEEEVPDPVVDPADEEAPSTDDTPTTPEPEAPATDETPSTEKPATDPVVDPVPAPEVPETTTTTATPVEITDVPAAPVVDAAPKARKAKKPKKEKLYDHNCDGHLDNGWVKKGTSTLAKDCPESTQSAPARVADPAPAPAAAPASTSDNAGRSESAKDPGPNGRSEAAKGPGSNSRSEGAPRHAKKSL